ncbi:MAG TPA: fibronectin type III domain-containing protein [Gemmatimonadaceae bacterium]|nr:fibronectin type III domain-containing protein [Gemmatimonadaceae bacterium]
MTYSLRQCAALAGVAAMAVLAACGSDSNDGTTRPVVVPAPTAVTVTASGSRAAKVTFSGQTGDNSYVVQRADGSTGGTFAQVGTVNASATTLSYDDAGLTPGATYRYRVAAMRGATQSAFSTEAAVTTLSVGGSVTLSTDITASRTLYADTTYTLKGFIHVTNGATLTIQPGTTIQGDFATLGSSLFIMRGAKINAVGTAASPIVFTSSQPSGQRQPGDWGGLIIIGNGIINRTGNIEIEGTGTVTGTTSGTNYQVLYSGGTANDDDSGELKYVRVEFAGFAPSLNNELNSFTFGAVGSKTKVSYVQALAGLDDSFEFFGGAVDGDHLVSYEAGDDNFDMSEGYSGRLQFVISFNSTVLTQRPNAGQPASDPEGIENDGCNGTGCTLGFNSAPFTIPVIANFTIVGTGDPATSGTSGGIGMMLRRGTGGYYVNGIVAKYPRAGISLRDAETFVRAGSVPTPDLATADLAVRNILFVETPTIFQTGGTSPQNAFDLATNGLVASNATAATTFTAFPATVTATTTATAFDWTPAAGSAAATGGLAAFTGKLAAKVAAPLASGNGSIAGTAYLGAAAPGGTKWWDGWTRYARN